MLTLAAPMNLCFPLSKRLRDYALGKSFLRKRSVLLTQGKLAGCWSSIHNQADVITTNTLPFLHGFFLLDMVIYAHVSMKDKNLFPSNPSARKSGFCSVWRAFYAEKSFPQGSHRHANIEQERYILCGVAMTDLKEAANAS